MKIEEEENRLVLTEIKDFNLAQTMECGQCFHFERVDEIEKDRLASKEDEYSDYRIAAFDEVIRIKQEKDVFFIENIDRDTFTNKFINYFDLEKDYGEIKERIAAASPELEDAIKDNAGIRLLNQEFFETMISFIISQNNQIPRIKKLVFDISNKWGEAVSDLDGYKMHLFPKLSIMKEISEDDFKEIKAGFRAGYLVDAIFKYQSGILKEEDLLKASNEDCMKMLTDVKGIGPKVANCIMLFSLGKRDSFPIDVWMKRAMQEIYFNNEEVSKERISAFAKEKFQELGGFAQQYIFTWARKG